MAVKLPTSPTPGKEVPPGWFLDFYNAVNRFMRNPVRGDGKTIRVGKDGTISAIVDKAPGGTSPGKVKVTSSDALAYLGEQFSANGEVSVSTATEGGDQLILLNLATGYDSRGVAKTFMATSDSASFDETLDDTLDYRGRHIECWLELTSDSDSTTPSTASKFLHGAPAADVTLVQDSPYTVYVESTDGSLHISAGAASEYTAVVWIRTSAVYAPPNSCPIDAGTPATWPQDDLVQQYTIANNATSGEADGAAICWRGDYAGPPSATWLEYRIKGGTITVTYTDGSPSTCYWSVADGLEYRDNTTYPTWSAAAPKTVALYLSGGKWIIADATDSFDMTQRQTGKTPVGDFTAALDSPSFETGTFAGFTVAEAT